MIVEYWKFLGVVFGIMIIIGCIISAGIFIHKVWVHVNFTKEEITPNIMVDEILPDAAITVHVNDCVIKWWYPHYKIDKKLQAMGVKHFIDLAGSRNTVIDGGSLENDVIRVEIHTK